MTVLAIGVTVSGAPYFEDAEQRRRTRYAVLAGLERARFVPSDARHINYFLWPKRDEATSFPLKILSFALPHPVQLYQLQHNHQGSNRDDVTTINPPQRTAVPYEWFEKVSLSDRGGNKSILVLWLKEEVLKGKPLTKLLKLKTFLGGANYNGDIKLIGPYSSDILYDMVKETRTSIDPSDPSCHATEHNWHALKKVKFYSYGASAPDDQLLKDLTDRCQTVQHYFDQLDIDLQRTIATDDTLARGVERQFACPNPSSDCRDGGDHARIHKSTYLRGLDGLLPSVERTEDRKQDKATTQGDKQTSAPDFFKIETDTKTLERPIGQGQFDYLRRISEHLRKIDDKLRKETPVRKIKAIGVLGSDVFDKLLILRALRPEFPEALFFTTDFDEAFTITSELPFTRNLIISSSFGPNLSDKFQGEIPFFRDTYETSAFLATLSAIGDPSGVFKDYIAEQLRVPRIFEIERSGDVLPFAGERAPIRVTPPQKDDRKHEENQLISRADGSQEEGRSVGVAQAWPCKDLSNCGDLQPPIEKLFSTFEEGNGTNLVKGLAGGAFLGLALLYRRKVPEGARVEVRLVVLGLGLAALTCFFWEQIALYLTDHGNGEPIALLQRVSVWPTVLLRVLGIILSWYFIWRAQQSLGKNLAGIADEMNLKPPPVDKPTLRGKIGSVLQDKHTLWNKITGVLYFSLESNQVAQTLPLKVDAAWRAYVDQERFWYRCRRAALYTVVMVVIYYFVLRPLFGDSTIPVRSDLAYKAYKNWTVLPDVFSSLFLTFFVFDATFFCLLFVNKLRRAQTASRSKLHRAQTEWPTDTMELFNDRLRLQTHLVDEWIDLEFVAKRTRCIGSLIYYPFVLIALLIVSRSTVFANYAPCLTNLIAAGISLSVVFGCAIMLWWAATAARNTAKQNLTDGIIAARGHPPKVADKSGDATQNDSDSNLATRSSWKPCGAASIN